MKSRNKRIKGHGPEFSLYRKVERARIQTEFKQLDLVHLFSREMKNIDFQLACRSQRVLDDAKRTRQIKIQKPSFSFLSCLRGSSQIYPDISHVQAIIPLESDYLDQLRNKFNILDKEFTSTDPITKEFLCNKIDALEEIADDLFDLSTYQNKLNKESILMFLQGLICDAQQSIKNFQESPSLASTASSDVSPKLISSSSLSL